MDASNPIRRPNAQRPARTRVDCPPARRRSPAHDPSVAVTGIERPRSGALKVTVQVIPLPDYESNPLRARQLAVIVDLLRSAASEAAERDAAPREHAQA